jgi:KUP system potassium uptake protein
VSRPATWNRGRELAVTHATRARPLDAFLRDALAAQEPPTRVRGTAVYPGNTPGMTPAVPESNIRHNRVLHETALFFANQSESAPRVDDETRIETRNPGAAATKPSRIMALSSDRTCRRCSSL